MENSDFLAINLPFRGDQDHGGNQKSKVSKNTNHFILGMLFFRLGHKTGMKGVKILYFISSFKKSRKKNRPSKRTHFTSKCSLIFTY